MAARCGCHFTARWSCRGAWDVTISVTYETKGGPLYVNAGIGTYYFPWRFNCRPEVTLVTI